MNRGAPPARVLPWPAVHPVLTFYLLAFGISWLGCLPAFARFWAVPLFGNPLWQLTLLLPASGPALAVLLTLALAGKSLLPRLPFRRFVLGQATLAWCAVAIALPALLLFATQAITRASTSLAGHSPSAPVPHLGLFALTSLLANPCEEIGWRGFAFQRLERKLNPLLASLLVGALWALWHLPFLLDPTSPMSALPVLPWSITILSNSVIVGWLYNGAGHSVLIAALFHIGSNLAPAIFGISDQLVFAAVHVLAALFLVFFAGGTRLAHTPPLATIP